MAFNYNKMAFKYRLPNSLKRCLNKTITVKIKIYGHFLRGVLKEFDQHLNLIMDDAEEIIVRRGVSRKRKKYENRIIIRGDSIITVDFLGTPDPVTK
ncbi:MAG: LSM domain-containing protein [Promethearchaeota archaeon]